MTPVVGSTFSLRHSVTWLRIHLGLYGAWTFDGDREFTAPHAIGAPRRRVGERGEHALKGGGGSALSGLNGGSLEPGHQGAGAHGPAPEEWEPPEPRGAVRLRLLEAVSAVTGLSTDRITVVKMRS